MFNIHQCVVVVLKCISNSQIRRNTDNKETNRATGQHSGRESPCSAGDVGSIPGLGRTPGEGNCNPLQYSYLENPMDRGACLLDSSWDWRSVNMT